MTEYGQENLEYKSMLNKQLWESLNLTSALNQQHISGDQVCVDGGGAHGPDAGGVGQEERLVAGGLKNSLVKEMVTGVRMPRDQ